MREKLEEIIEKALEDNVITADEIEAVKEEARKIGINRPNEIEMMLKARLAKKQKNSK